MKTPIVKMK